MINELRNLSRVLVSNGITVDEWHRKYKALPNVKEKSPCIRIWLDDNGMVCGMESLSAELVSMLRKYGDNQSSFPAFNINSLYRITAPDVITEIERLKSGKSKPDVDKIKTWRTCDNWIKGAPGQVKRSMSDCSGELVELCNSEGQASITAVLADLCKKAGDGFRSSLEKCAFEKLRKQEDIPLMLMLLFHTGIADKEHSKDTGARISVILDVYNWAAYGHPVASEYTTRQINTLLLASAVSTDDTAEALQTDAFGTAFINPNEPMPSVKLSGFEVTLRSMFDGQPCQHRYEKINDESYPIAPDNRSLIKKALEWIAQPSNQYITWVKIDKDEIAFVYPSKLPEVPPRFASLFGREKTVDSGQAKYRFEGIAKDFAKVFQGISPDQKPDVMQIFSIRKIDKARSKVLFTHNATPKQLITAAESWSAGCKNLPPLDVGEPDTPFPLEVPDVLNAVWKQNGERADGKTPVTRMKYYQGMELLLDALPTGAIQYYLHIAVENFSGLFVHLGCRLHSGIKPDGKSERKKLDDRKAAAAQSLSVLGLLLHRCNERKENYMDELAFLLGQWLHVSDELHALYCMVKRDGDIPPQLAGSAVFVTAGTMPYQALALLSTRMKPYTDWALKFFLDKPDENDKKMSDTEKEQILKQRRKAKYLLNLLNEFSDRVNPQMDKSIRFGDYEKAKLYIGYMASLPKKEKPITDDNNTTGGIENE